MLRLRSLVVQSIAVAALLALVAFAIADLVPGSSARLERASAGWLALGVALEVTAIAAYGVLFYGVFSYGAYRIGRLRAAQIGTGELAGYVASPGGAAGPALRIWALLRGGMPFREVMTRSVVHAAAFQIPYVAAAAMLGIAVVSGFGVGHAQTVVALAPVLLVMTAVAATLVATRLARRPARSTAGWRKIAREALVAVPVGVRQLPVRLREPRLVPSATGYWVCDCAVLAAAVHAAHGSAPIGVIVLAYMLGQLGNALPLPGGVGGVEPIMLAVLTSSGVGLVVGATAVVLYRFVSLGLQGALGAVAVATLIPSMQRVPSDEVTPEASPHA